MPSLATKRAGHRANKARPQPDEIEVSVIIPCLNEADTLEKCVLKALEALSLSAIHGEVLVADNGSRDGCVEIASRLGVRVVQVKERGYGSALMGGIRAARGRYVVVADADDSYDFLEIPRFVEALRKGTSLVQGCRFSSGGGKILPGAMPFAHRWIGNPGLSLLARLMFHIPVNDIYCGMRGFTRELIPRLQLRCTGMEFATEMVIKCAILGESISQVPTTLHKDGRVSLRSHLRTFRDGWKTLRLFLLFSPRWLFLYPGIAFFSLGVCWYFVALFGAHVGSAVLGLNSLLVAGLAMTLGQQMTIFAIVTRTLATSERLLPPPVERWIHFYRIGDARERGDSQHPSLFVIGVAMIARIGLYWYLAGFPPLNTPPFPPTSSRVSSWRP